MRVSLASTAELYAEHRRTGSTRKRDKIAAELQRRHDELNSRPGYLGTWWRLADGNWLQITRFDFALGLPVSQPSTLNHQPAAP